MEPDAPAPGDPDERQFSGKQNYSKALPVDSILKQRVLKLGGNALLGNALALMASSAGTAILGVGFWGLSAHLVKQSEIGRTSAEVLALILLANLSQLSYGPIFERFLPVAGAKTTAFILRAYALTLATAVILTAAYVALGLGHAFLPTSLHWRIYFVLAVMLWSIFTLQDSAMVGLRASKWIPVENILYALVKLALLPVCISLVVGQGIFVAWMAPVLVAVISIAVYMFGWRIPHNEATTTLVDKLPSNRRLVGLAGAQYTTLLTSVALTSVASLVIIDKLGATVNAYYFIAAQLAWGPSLLADGIGRSFLVELSHQSHRARHHSNVAFGALATLIVPSVLGGYYLAPLLLGLFGHEYAVHATTLMRLMLLSLPGYGVNVVFATYAWYDQRVWQLALRQGVTLVIFIVLLLSLVGHVGILAVGWASVISTGIQAIFVLPSTIRRFRTFAN